MEKESKTTRKTTAASGKSKLTLLQAVETIVEQARNSSMCTEFMSRCKKEIQLIAKSYGITPQQAVLFCITLECGPNHVNHYELPHFLEMSNVKALSFGPDINEMVKMRIMRYCDKSKTAFGVTDTVLSGLRENKAIIRKTLLVDDCIGLFEVLDVWFDLLEEDDISPVEVAEDLVKLYEDNRDTVAFAKQMLDLKLDNKDMLMLSFFCHRLINADDAQIIPRQISDLFDHRSHFRRAINELSQGTHLLMQQGWLEHVCNDGTADTSMFTLTDKAKRELLGELDTSESTMRFSGLMEAENIKPKTMFYPKSMQKQIDELGTFLDTRHFKDIQRRLAANGFRTGFACLFYGGPGTGKTETAYQLARATGRSIMMVDVPQIKSKWVGDSEKNIKALFDRYRMLANRSVLTPILLFNEADAIFGVRKNGAENAVDKMENTIQNIILQEMENLQGIMIATTNLQGNLDSAFDRRFLYKVKFEKPDAAVRCSIWQEMVPGLSDSDAMALARAFELSGGQIENVARKDTINRILHGDRIDHLAILMDYCRHESLDKATSRQPMGFK